MQNKEDIDLISEVIAGEHRAYGVLVDRYQSKVFNFVLYTIRDGDEAAEVTQDTFVKAYRSLHTFRNESKFATWLLRIAYFSCMTRLKKTKPTLVDISTPGLVLDGSNNVTQASDMADMKTILTTAMSVLSQDEQMMITLYYYNELSIKEICEITGDAPSKVKVSLHRCRKKLLKVLQKMGIQEWVI